MKNLTIEQRVKHYAKSECGKKWPASIPHIGEDGRFQACWFLGNDYRNKAPLYGAYPPNFLKRIRALFPDMKAHETLHLFSGSLPKGGSPDFPGITVDINPNHKPDLVWNAHNLADLWGTGAREVSCIVADPPYSKDDAVKYGTVMIHRKKVLNECSKVIRTGGFLTWLDCVWPMFRNSEWDIVGAIGIWRSTNHRVRGVTIFRRKPRLLLTKKRKRKA